MSSGTSKKQRQQSQLDLKHHKALTNLEWYSFSARAKTLWTDPFWYSAILLELSFLGVFVTSFVAILQVENKIAKIWVLWIFYIAISVIFGFHVFFYAYIKYTKTWEGRSIYHFGKMNTSISVLTISVIFSLAGLSSIVSRPVVPSCCSSDVPGLTTLPLDIPLFVQWQCLMVFVNITQYLALLANLFAIANLIYPDRKLTVEELREVPFVTYPSKGRADNEDLKY